VELIVSLNFERILDDIKTWWVAGCILTILNPLVVSVGKFRLYLSFWPFFVVGYLSRLWPTPVGSL
jgi:hypothetical protein